MVFELPLVSVCKCFHVHAPVVVARQAPDLKKLDKSSPLHGSMEGPVASFLVQERLNAVRLMNVVKSSLGSLRRVLDGTTLLTSEVEKTAVAMLNHEVSLFLFSLHLLLLDSEQHYPATCGV